MDKNEARGYIQVYTGNGKGKTTAAIGLAIRAAGAGLKVYIAQFIKMGDYSEIKALKRYSDLITVEQFGLGRFTDGKPLPEDIAAAQKGLKQVKSVMASGGYCRGSKRPQASQIRHGFGRVQSHHFGRGQCGRQVWTHPGTGPSRAYCK
jgi:hypothetical protein